jgi:hypothetical protein
MTVPNVVMPNPWLMMLTLIRTHADLPAAFNPVDEHIVEQLPDHFPAGMPYLHVVQVPGGRQNVQLRLATGLFDLHVYHPSLFDAMEYARQFAGLVQSLEQKKTDLGGFTLVRLVDAPFPLSDPDSGSPRAVIPISATYRPL